MLMDSDLLHFIHNQKNRLILNFRPIIIQQSPRKIEFSTLLFRRYN